MKRLSSLVLILSLLLTGCAAVNQAGLVVADSVVPETEANLNGTQVPVETPAPIAITLLSAEDQGNGVVLVEWETSGEAPDGFKGVWSATNAMPTFPEDPYSYINDPAARSAYIQVDSEGNYSVRVCRYTGGVCDSYTAPMPVVVAPFTGEPTEPPSTGTVVPTQPPSASGSLTITGIADSGPGMVSVCWSAVGSFPNGYKLVWAADTEEPVYPGDSYVYVSDPASTCTSAAGVPGVDFYFRVCAYNGSGCSFYSPTVGHRYAAVTTEEPGGGTSGNSLSLNSVSASGGDSATASWTATGSFPMGYKLVWSDTNSSPVYPGDNYNYISDPGTTSASLSGLSSGVTYYVRVCQYTGGGCTNYSNTITYTHP